MAAEPESPGETPKSIRPIPHDLDIMLRAACTGVVRNNKPSHEYHKGGKAQLDYATIRRGGGNNPAPAPRKPDPAPAALAKADSNENRFSTVQRDSTLSANLASPEKSNRVSHISASTENPPQPTGDGTQVQVQRSRAQSRADQIMAGSPPKALALQRERTNSHHSRSQSTPQGTWAFPAPNLGSLRRPKAAPRAHSMETGIIPQINSTTENTWSDGNKAAEPSQEALNLTKTKTNDVDAEWMHEDSEKRQLLRQQAFAETALSRHTTRIEPKPESAQEEEKENIAPAPHVPALVATVPERKPVPNAGSIASPDSASVPTSPVVDSATEDSLSIDGQTTREELPPFSYPQRSDSRGGRTRSRGTGVPMNSRAVSRARSITREVTREVKSFVRNASRNASRTRQPRLATDEPLPRSRRPSISRTATNVKEYFRPGTSTKQSLDVPRSAANLKSRSHESFVSTRSDSLPAKDTPMQRSQRSSRYQNATLSTGRSSPEADTDTTNSHHYTTSTDTLQQKRQVDLNRALPPLPRLGSWHADASAPASPKQAPEPPKFPQGSDVPSPTQEGMTTLKRLTSRESRSPLPSPKMGAVHDYVALRMGTAVSRQPSKAKPPRERGNPNLPSQSSRPGMSKRVPTDPRDAKSQLNDSGSPATKTHASRVESPASRRRSKSLQEPVPTDISEKLRKASANAPDGRPIHAVGQAKLINTTSTTRSQFDGLAGKIGRKLSTKRRNGPPSHPPPPPPPHLELPQRKAKTTASSPNGLSRANSTYHSKSRPDLTRKMSMEEYGRNYDGRFHKDNDNLVNPPPPVAVGGSKNSPRMNIGNFLPSKFQQQQQQQQQQSGSKKWWHLGLGNNGDGMDQVPQNGDHANGSLGVRY